VELAWRLCARRSQPNARSPTILIDKFDAGPFERPSNYSNGSPPGLVALRFQLTDGHDSDPGMFSQNLLAPSKEPASGSALFWTDQMATQFDSPIMSENA
jgi:hypothetical protein